MRRHYQNPPIHEVAFEVRFVEASAPGVDVQEKFRAVSAALAPHLGDVTPMVDVSVSMGPGSSPTMTQRVTGLQLKSETPEGSTWLCKLAPRSITLHLTRGQGWPAGLYYGWESFVVMLEQVLSLASDSYAGVGIARAGQRYINKIAVPVGANRLDPKDWFSFGIERGEEPGQPLGFDVTRFYMVEPGIRCRMRLATIHIDDSEIAQDHKGVAYDIDVYSEGEDVPSRISDVVAWSRRAHQIENRLFESGLTRELKMLFTPNEEERDA